MLLQVGRESDTGILVCFTSPLLTKFEEKEKKEKKIVSKFQKMLVKVDNVSSCHLKELNERPQRLHQSG